MKITSVTFNEDTGQWEEKVTDLGPTPELDALLEAARAEWAALKAAGTPYWCIHEGRGVDHPQAYWKNDTPDAKIHRKHGVMCRECGGYIQEG